MLLPLAVRLALGGRRDDNMMPLVLQPAGRAPDGVVGCVQMLEERQVVGVVGVSHCVVLCATGALTAKIRPL